MIKMPNLKAGFYKNKFRENDKQYSHYGKITLDGKTVECVMWFNEEDSFNEDGKLYPHVTIKLNKRKYEDAERLTEDYRGENVVDHPDLRQTDYSARLDAQELATSRILDALETLELLKQNQAEEEGETVESNAA